MLNNSELQLNQLSEHEQKEAYNSGYLSFLENGVGILRKVTLDEWLEKIKELEAFGEVEPPYSYSRFPSDYHKKEYLSNIANRPLEEIKWLISNFLPTGLTYQDKWEKAHGMAKLLIEHKTPAGENLIDISYVDRRWVQWALSDGKLVSSPRETVYWVLDLIDNEPEQAIQVLNGYFAAHGQNLPDSTMDGLEDCIALIRARYSLFSIPEDLVASLSSREFEYLVERLYHGMGYNTELTPPTHDGGKDVIARKTGKGLKTEIFVEVKHSRRTIGIDVVRQLRRVVDKSEANKGVIVTTSRFSPEALEEEKNDHRLELIALDDFVQLMNRYHGINWTRYIDLLVAESKRLHEKR